RSVMTFKEWGDYFVGGVWTTTNARRKKEEIRCEWILDKSFIRLTWKTGAESREEFHGIDPATGQWTIWGLGPKAGSIRASARARRRASGVTGLRARARTGRCPLSTRTSSSGRTKIGMRSGSSSWTAQSSALRSKR